MPSWLKLAVVEANVLYGAVTGWLTVRVPLVVSVAGTTSSQWYVAVALTDSEANSPVDAGALTVKVADAVPPALTAGEPRRRGRR